MNTLPISTSVQYSSRSSSASMSRDQRLNTVDSLVKNLLRRRNLIMALVKREIEFLSTWHNTAADVNLVFPGEEQLTKWSAQTTFTEKAWRDHVKLAWNISPSLAFHLCARFVYIFLLMPCIQRFNFRHIYGQRQRRHQGVKQKLGYSLVILLYINYYRLRAELAITIAMY